MLVFNGSHYEPLEVDANKRLDANIFTSSALDMNIVSSSGTISVDGSGVTQPISAASLPLPTGAATESTLSTLDGKVTAVDTGNVTVVSAPVVQGSDGGTPTDIQVDSHGCVSVKIKELENSGTYGNAWSNASVVASGVSNTIDVSALSHANIFISDSDFSSTDTYSVFVSQDNTNFHHIHTFYPYDRTGGGSTREDKALLELHGMLFLYIQNDGAAHSAVYGSVYGSP